MLFNGTLICPKAWKKSITTEEQMQSSYEREQF